MSLIGNEKKDWIIEFKGERPAEFITKTKADALMVIMQDKRVTYVELTDDEGNLREMIEKREIKGIKSQNSKPSQDEGEVRWICSYGTRHRMNVKASECGCDDKFGIIWWDFLEKMQVLYGIDHSHQITKAMQDAYLKDHAKESV